MTISGKQIADTAVNSGLLGTPYAKMDCQAFVEAVLAKAGLRIINYRGSNHMWRELVYDRNSVRGNTVPAGALVFIVRFDGGEKKRGYHDDAGNATHVGIALGDGRVMESTTGGVQYGNLSRFTDFGLIKDVDYTEKGTSDGGESDAGAGRADFGRLMQLIGIVRDNVDELEEYIRGHYQNA